MLTEQQYNNLKAAWNDSLDLTEGYFMDVLGEKLSYSEAQKALGHSWLSQENKDTLEQVLNNLYTEEVVNNNFS